MKADPFLYLRAARQALARFGAKNGTVMSSHVAMSMMLALFPFILFVVALAGVVYRDVPQEDVIELFFGMWPEGVAAPIVTEVRAVLASSSTRLMTLGGVLAVFFASNGVDAVRVAISRAYHDHDTRPFWKTRLIALGSVLAGGAALLLAVVLEIWIPLYSNVITAAVPEDLGGNLGKQLGGWFAGVGPSWLVIVSLPIAAVFGCHMVLPARRHSMRQVLPGVILTIALWAVAGWGFSIYIARFATYSATYAGLAGAMSALIFLNMMAAILILGAEFNGALLAAQEDKATDEDSSSDS